MGDSNKQKNIHTSDQPVENIIDSDELFDLDMPLDEPDDIPEKPNEEIQATAPENESPDISDSLQDLIDEFPNNVPQNIPQNNEINQPEDEPETLFTVEQDLEQLLDHNHLDGEDEFEQASQPIHADTMNMEEDSASMDTSTVAEMEPMEEMPVPEKTKAKPRSGMANSFIITLGLIAILIAVLAAWLGLNVSQQKLDLASLSAKLQQQITLLEQQQQQQNSQLTKHIETLEKRLNTLTQVIAHKTTEQWRASLQQQPARPKKTAVAALQTGRLKTVKSEMPTRPKPAIKAVRETAGNKAPKAKKPVVTPATAIKTPAIANPVAKPLTTAAPLSAAPLSMYEVAPGTVKGWVVNIYSVTSRSTAERRIRQLKIKHIDATYVRVQIKGKTWYRVRASSFKDKRAAATFKKFLQEYHGIDAWYSYLK